MKTILTGALIVMTALGVLSLWGSVHARRMSGPSSQIYIHGTPVCVMQHGGEIEASIGECGSSSGTSEGGWGGFHRAPRPFGNTTPGLPPGHPPIGEYPDLGDEAVRRIPI